MELDAVIDDFVARINTAPREALPPEDVPAWLRGGPADKYGQFMWSIKKADCHWIYGLDQKLPIRFPPSFHSLISRYAFPGFQLGPIFFFGNSGENLYWELQYKIFADECMSRTLLENGFLQIGHPEEPNYDPICFDMNRGKEGSIVQIDHEGILLKSKVRVTGQIAGSFVAFLQDTLG